MLGVGASFINSGGWTTPSPENAVAGYVGSETCAGCHQAETKLWQASQHKVAMQHATAESVLGDFSGATFDYYGVTSRFFRKDGKFLVETDGPDGKLATFEVAYTFGVDPLQQYLIEFPDGRLQALSLAWDSRPRAQGGQRWLHLYPDEAIKHDDVLHWTKFNQNWNFMCAECHSTGVRKNYDAATDHFHTAWSEISVGCEACHGQGSRHVGWAKDQKSLWPFRKSQDPAKGLLAHFDERQDIAWRPDPKTGKPLRSVRPALLRKEVETCGLCHARRAGFSEDWVPGQWLSQTHVVAPLSRGIYHADGQTRDVEEPYNYAPFKQSKMFAAGVTCSDCHEPHGAKLRAPGDGVCLQCHGAETYAAATHSHHADTSSAPTCVSCHMPVRTYMTVDQRHDHSFRVPRPDLSVTLGTPNACSDCHTDKPAQWAADAVAGWFGPKRGGFQNYAAAFHAARIDDADAARQLTAVALDTNAPAVARATALAELASRLTPATLNAARTGLADPDPMVRIGALDMLEGVPAIQLWPLVAPLLSDAVRGVRIRAVALLAAAPTAGQPEADRAAFDRAAGEFVAAQRQNADRPEARATLANFLAQRGRPAEAEAEYKAALRLSPHDVAATVNLADLYRQTGRDAEAVAALRAAVDAAPQDAGLHHALGLALVRTRQSEAALAELSRAAELAPGQSRLAYTYAVALNSAGRRDEALAALRENLTRHPTDRDTLMALASINRDAGNLAAALDYAQQLSRLAPDDRSIAAFVDSLRRQAGGTR
jgi:predicted CXXCH cytochrome family protein